MLLMPLRGGEAQRGALLPLLFFSAGALTRYVNPFIAKQHTQAPCLCELLQSNEHNANVVRHNINELILTRVKGAERPRTTELTGANESKLTVYE